MTTTMIEPTEVPADVETPSEQKGFHITTDAAAEWLLGKLANIEAEKARVTAQAEKIVKQLDADAEGLRFLYGAELEAYVKAKLAATGNRRKSVHFLQGTCSFRTVRANVKIAGSQNALEYARACFPALVQVTESLDTAGYRKLAEDALREEGELLPGVEIIEARESFSMKFGGKEE